MARWTVEEIPRLDGKLVVVTGANSGIGWEATRHMAARGAHVVMACRNLEKAQEAAEEIEAQHPGASLEVMRLDLADLSSVREFALGYARNYERCDRLINNAGLMAIPYRETVDGFEMQLGVNHLGHFALTGRMLDVLWAAGEDARVVTVSSQAHQMGKIRFGDLNSERSYQKWAAYGQSKLANLLFTFELQRRFSASRWEAKAVACHPGYAATELQTKGPKMAGSGWMERLSALSNEIFAQSAEMGALPTLYAAFGEDVRGGDYVGPEGALQWRGYPEKVRPSERAQDVEVGMRLWSVSEDMTGVPFGARLLELASEGGA